MSRDQARVEQNFLGCLLRSPHEYWQVHDIVAADMFTVAHHRDIYGAIAEIGGAGRQITTTALLAHLPEEYEDIGSAIGILAALRENAAEAGSASDYAGLISEHAADKRLDAITKWIDKERKQNKRPEDIASELALRAQEIMAQASPLRPIRLADATKKVITASKEALEKDVMPGFSTGLRGLDEMIGLVMGGDLISVVGSLGEGKSALLSQIGKHIAASAHVLSCHNEMSIEQNATRALSAESGLSVREIREGAFAFDGREAIQEAQGRIEVLQYHVYVDPKMTIRAIKSRALQMRRTIGLGAITIDGFKRLRTDVRHRDKWDRYEELTGSIKELAIELNVPIFLAVQRTRRARRDDDPVPKLDDADAPTIETDSDTVLGVFRRESWLMMNRPNPKAGGEAQDEFEGKVRRAKGIAEIIALKVRSGQPFEKREFAWIGHKTMFADL